MFGEPFSYNTDVYSYALILEELAKKKWSTLEGVFGKSLLGKSKREMHDNGVEADQADEVHQNNLKNDYYENVITPKVTKVSDKVILIPVNWFDFSSKNITGAGC